MSVAAVSEKNVFWKMAYGVTGAAIAIALSGCQANDAESEIIAQEALEQANRDKAVYCMKVLEVDLDVKRFGEECVADIHIEHAPHVPDGKEGLLRYFAGQLEKMPQMHADIKRAGADGDLVWMQIHFKPTPDSKGSHGIHIFRMEDGKFAEHWGVGRKIVESKLHDNPSF